MRNHILLTPNTEEETTTPLALKKTDATEATPLEHTAERTSSTTLNHVRGPSAGVEIDEMKAERQNLVARLQKLNRNIADAELVVLMAAAV